MRTTPYTKANLRAQVREVRLSELGYSSYNAYLRSSAWRDVKTRYRASDLPQMCMCGETKVDLHHTTYDRVGRERPEDLVPLCRACHIEAHQLEAAGLIDLDLKGFYYDLNRAYAYAGPERKRKVQAAKDFAEHEYKAIDYEGAQRALAAYAREQKTKRGRSMRTRLAMYAAAGPEAVAKRRERIFAEAQARHRRQQAHVAFEHELDRLRPSAIPQS